MRASGTRTVPMRSSPPNPTGTARPVMVLNTVVLPDPAKPTSPIFIGWPSSRVPGRSRRAPPTPARCGSRRLPWPGGEQEVERRGAAAGEHLDPRALLGVRIGDHDIVDDHRP